MHTRTESRRKWWVPLALGLLVLGAGCSDSGKDDDKPSGDADAGTDGGTNETPDGGGPTEDCIGSTFLQSLGKDRLLVGAQMEDGTAAKAAFDLHYLYITGGIFDSANVCTSCTSGCTAFGTTCAGAGCAWWGCWQDVSQPPGDYLRGFISRAKGRGQIPFVTYYEQYQSSGRGEGQDQLVALNDLAFMRRYFSDWRFVVQQVGNDKALLHIEPDLWGYLQFFDGNASRAVQVATANPTDCGGMANNAGGLGRCMIAMARKYAPNAKVALHASPWATRTDVYLNTSASFDMAGEARKVADFLLSVGAADSDFIVVEASDRDAGYYETVQHEDTWWDDTNATRPNFQQAFLWAKTISERLNKPSFWWQLPVGNMSLNNTNRRYKDNRVDYFFGHTAEVAATHAMGFMFGAGNNDTTTPETDNGNLVNKVKAYKTAGGQKLCP